MNAISLKAASKDLINWFIDDQFKLFYKTGL